jgi:Golgi nucleoside diphosphatase
MVSALLLFLGGVMISVVAAAAPLPLTKEYSFVAVFDAGSSGTRVHIYRPLVTGGSISASGAVPDLAPNPSSKKVKPGLSSFAGKEEQVAAYMLPLAEFIVANTKEQPDQPVKPADDSPSPSNCLVIFGATAGLRSVPNSANKLLDAAKTAVAAAVPCAIGSFRVISGEEEGGYGWLSVQALSKRLPGQSNAADGYLGTLEVGGASMQVTVPLQPPALNSAMTRFKAPFGAQSELLYSHSFLGYGLDSARRSYNAFYAAKLTADASVYVPLCLALSRPHAHRGKLSHFSFCDNIPQILRPLHAVGLHQQGRLRRR